MTRDLHQSGDELLGQVLGGADDDAANKLLRAFFSGYPIERLRLLLRSESDEAVKAGTWIASELGAGAAPVMSEISRLLRHPLKYVRFFAADAVLGGATTEDGDAIAIAVDLIRDADDAVRWKALTFLARASKSQLAAGIPFVEDRSVATRLRWLLVSATESDQISAKLAGDHLDRMFAVAAAVRLGDSGHPLLERAMQSGDPEVQSFAREALEAMN